MPALQHRFLARFTQAVLTGSAVALLAPLLLVLVEFASLPLLLPDGTPDDGYAHTITSTLMAWPVLYLVVAVFHAGLFGLLARLGQLRWPVAMGVSAAWPCAVFPAMGGGMLATVVLSASFAAGAWVVCRIAAAPKTRGAT